MSCTSHPKYKDHWIIIFWPYGTGKVNGKRQNKRVRIVYGPCTYEEALRYEVSVTRAHKAAKPILIDPCIYESFLPFCSDYKLRVSPYTFRDYQSAWKKHLLPFFGHLKFTMLTPELINQFKAKCLIDGYKPKTINKLLTYLSAMVSYASSKEINMCNPLPFKIKGFDAKQTQPPPKSIPSIEEVHQLLQALPDNNAGALIKLLYYCGLRLGDARNIMCEHVNLAHGFFIVRGKGSKYRTIPIIPEARELIEPRMKEKGLLLPNPKTGRGYIDLQKTLDTACKHAKIQRLTHHTLRHAFGVHMVMKGANLRSIQLLMGHSSTQVTEIYTKLAPSFLAEEIMKISRS